MQKPAAPPVPPSRSFAVEAIGFTSIVLTFMLALAAVPGVSLTNLDSQFRWRKDFVRSLTESRYAIGDHLFNNTLAGKDGWLFYRGGTSIQEYQRTDQFAPGDLKAFQQDLDRLKAALATDGRSLVLVIAPNKDTIYPQYMPDQLPVIGSVSRTDQFMAYMGANSQTPIVDLRRPLRQARTSQQVYYRTDSHWNDLGAYYAYAAIMDQLSRDDPGLTPHPLSDFGIQVKSTGGDTDLPPLMGYLSIPEDDPFLEPRFAFYGNGSVTTLPDGEPMRLTTNQQSNLPRLLVFGDSFYFGLEPYLKTHFSRMVEMPYWEVAGPSLRNWIDQEQPDIVIIECAERDLGNLFPLLHNAQP